MGGGEQEDTTGKELSAATTKRVRDLRDQVRAALSPEEWLYFDRSGHVILATLLCWTRSTVVIAAILHSLSPLLTGSFTVPVQTTAEHFRSLHTPEMGQELANTEVALTFLNNAAGAFRTTTEKMRDLPAEERAEAGSAAAKELRPHCRRRCRARQQDGRLSGVIRKSD